MQRLSVAAITVVSLWLALPALFATHVEAFSARLLSMAIMGSKGTLGLDDVAYPLNIEYFYTTRGLVIQLLRALISITHSYGDINFRILIWISFAVFAISCIEFAKSWGNAPRWASALVLVVTPGILESGFFFADNLVSAAAAALACALATPRSSVPRWLLIGALYAVALLARIDAILVAPGLLLLSVLISGSCWTSLLLRWLCAAAGSAVTLLAYAKLTGITLLQSVQIARLHNAIHASWGDKLSLPRLIVLFFGPSIVLALLGALTLWKSSDWKHRAAMVLWPLVLYAFALHKAVELRDYLLLGGPFLVLLASAGIVTFIPLLRSPNARLKLASRGALALYAISLVLPPLMIMSDGPRLAIGRIYSPLLWFRWQGATTNAIGELKTIGEHVQTDVVLTTLFQSDRYLHLALLQTGFTVAPMASHGPCERVDVYRRGHQTLYHLRTENPYYLLSLPPFALPTEYVRAYQVSRGIECVAGIDATRVLLVTWGRMWQGYLLDTQIFHRGDAPMEEPFPAYGIPHIGKYKYLQIQRVVPLQMRDLATLHADAEQVTHAFESGNKGGWQALRSDDDFRSLTMPFVWQSIPALDKRVPRCEQCRWTFESGRK